MLSTCGNCPQVTITQSYEGTNQIRPRRPDPAVWQHHDVNLDTLALAVHSPPVVRLPYRPSVGTKRHVDDVTEYPLIIPVGTPSGKCFAGRRWRRV
jgi:hypothetical protein